MTTYTTVRYAGEDFDREECEFYPPVITDSGIRCGHHGSLRDIYHQSVAAVRACKLAGDDMMAEQRAECYAEGVMSWVAGGGSPEDAGRYASVVASGREWDGGIGGSPMTGESCEHGLDAGLCAGSQHYPLDDPGDW